jgi:predicted Zn finger-like uncharacterized protein
MKFACDNCGAQYMIADDKIGPKGVKVRCKKCAHVIVLRPGKLGADAAPSLSTAGTAPARPTGGVVAPPSVPPPDPSDDAAPSALPSVASSMLPSLAPEPRAIRGSSEEHDADDGDEATIALLRARPATSELALDDAALSSEFGLSQEFAARGFEDAPADRGPSTPFSRSRGRPVGGGSLELAGEADALSRLAGLGAAPPNDEAAPEPQTRVDAAPRIADEFGEVATSVGGSQELARLAGLDVAIEPSERAEPSDGHARPSANGAHAAPVARAAPVAHAAPVARPQGGAETLAEQSDDLGGALRRELDREELSEDRRPTPTSQRFRADTGRPDTGPSASDAEAAPSGLLQRPGSVTGRAAAIRVAGDVGENLEQEIGSAFDAVFGQGGDPFAALGGDVAADDQKATRVFDTDAMQKLQREQDIAGRDVAPRGGKAASAQAEEWYLAVNDEQVGPMTLAQVEARWDAAEVDANALCWKQGMADWIAMRFVRELEAVIERPQKGKRPDLSAEPPTRAHKVRDVSERPLAKERRPTEAEPASLKPEPLAASTAAGGGALRGVVGDPEPAAEESEADWRPSAASALASLAQAELSSTTAAQPTAKESVKEAKIVPSAINASKLPFEPISASMFGAGEQTFTRTGTSLPKTPDLASSVSLREPTRDRTGKSPVLVAALIGLGLAFAGVVIALVVVLTRPTPAPVVAQPPPAPPSSQVVVQPSLAPSPVSPQATVAAAPGTEGTAAAAAEGAPNPSPSGAPAATPSGAPAASPSAEPIASAPPEAARPTEPTRAAREDTKSARERKKEREAKRAAREEVAEAAPPPAPPPPPARKKDLEADDLLADGSRSAKPTKSAAPSPAPADDVPDQLDESDILRVIRAHRSEINGCVEKQVADDPGVDGVMTVSFVVQRTGATNQVAVSPDKFKGAVVGKCVVGAVKTWKFPRFGGAPMPLDFPVKVQAR